LVTVLAVDGGDPPKTGSVVVNISVLDANDNNPQFDNSSYEVAVSVYRPLSHPNHSKINDIIKTSGRYDTSLQQVTPTLTLLTLILNANFTTFAQPMRHASKKGTAMRPSYKRTDEKGVWAKLP